MKKEFMTDDSGAVIQAEVDLLRRQLRSGDLPKGREYIFDPYLKKFRVLTASEQRSKPGQDWQGQVDLLRRRLRLVELVGRQ